MPWGLVHELPELGDALAEEGVGVDEDLEDFEVEELDAWQSPSSPPHVEDPILAVEAICDSSLISPVLMHWK
mgnify:CR=1 FL=1